MSRKSFKDLFKRYPYAGVMKEWNSERGFGFISVAGFRETLFAHISNRDGPRPRGLQLAGKKCLLAIGCEPRRPDQAAAISWILEDEVDAPLDGYADARRVAVREWNVHQLESALRAKWYASETWGGRNPQRPLMPDRLVIEEVEKRLNDPKNLEDHLVLLRAKTESPYHLTRESNKKSVLRDGLKRLAERFPHLFGSATSAQVSKLVSELGPEAADILAPIQRRVFFQEAVAIDIESDGDELFQIGYTDSDEGRLIEVGEPNISTDEACRQIASILQSKWIVGHNVLAWDLPRLQQFSSASPSPHEELKDLGQLDAAPLSLSSPFIRQHGIWDTLLISTLMEPWKSSHALTTSAVAHRADSDALAARDLFNEQTTRLALDYASLLHDSASITPTRLLELCSSAMLHRRSVDYPKPPSFLADTADGAAKQPSVLIPEVLLPWCAWVPSVQYVWPEGYTNSEHFFLSSVRVQDALAGDSHIDPSNTLLLHLLRNAEAHNVHVIVSMVPRWLRRQCSALIERCATVQSDSQIKAKWHIATYESCRIKTDAARSLLASALKVAPELGGLSLLEQESAFTEEDVTNVIPLDTDGVPCYRLHRTTAEATQLLRGVSPVEGECYWLEYHPADRRSPKPWRLWVARHIGPVEEPSDVLPTTGFFAPDLLLRPKWIDVDAGIAVATDTLWPTTANRAAYWREVITQLLSLCRASTTPLLVVLLVDRPVERDVLRRLLSDLGLSGPDGQTFAQQLLRAKKASSATCAVDLITSVVHWQQTSLEVGCPVHFVLEAVPVAQWLMCCMRPEDQTAEADTTMLDQQGRTEGDDGDSEPDHPGYSTSPFTVQRVETCLSLFLGPWMRSVFGEDAPTVLDARLNLSTTSLARIGHVKDIAWHPLDADQVSVFERYRDELGQPEVKPPPTDTEAYQKFLDDHWRDHSNPDERPWVFKAETQQPAIDAICGSSEDLLVKLPTGEGKSVIFQVPALLRGFHTQRLTIVITPLRALMRDQVTALWKKGFFTSVDYLSADREPWETSEVYQGVLDNRIKLLYIAPERFRVSRFREALDRRYQNDGGLEFVVVDEAHCISQWGFEFRPDYFFAIEEVRRLYRSGPNPVRVLLFSATVTQAVEGDLRGLLGHRDPGSLLVRPEAYRHPIQGFIQTKPEEVPVPLYGEGRAAKIIARTSQIEQIIREAKPDSRQSVVLVFVTRRDHAEAIAALLAKDLPNQFHVEFFHAGMPPGERLRVYESVKRCGSGGTNVLVATKAFGMGMDIPNIHWCVHLAPPSYLEDYLQEVGRTGRGARERVAAGLDHVECTLLFHPEDFADNHGKVRRGMIQPHDLILLWAEVLKRSALTTAGRRISILPTDGYEEMTGDRLRRGLSWLEREPAKRLSILGYLPDMLRIQIDRNILEQCSLTEDSKGAVARAIMRLYEASPSSGPTQQPTKPATDSQSGLWGFLKRFVGFLFAPPEATQGDGPQGAAVAPPTGKVLSNDEAEINLGAILAAAKLPCADEVYRVLFHLQKSHAIDILRDLSFKEGSMVDQSSMVWKWLDALMSDLAGRAYPKGREVPPEELMQIVYETIDQQDNIDQKTRSNIESVVRAGVRLLNVSGLRIREKLNEERRLVFSYALANEALKLVKWRVKAHIKKAKALEALLQTTGEGPVNLGDLLKLLGDNGHIRDLRVAIRLVSDIGLYSTEHSLFCYSYLLEINTLDALLDKADRNIRAADLQMYEQLERVNRFSELRSFCTEVFARFFPSNDERKKFVDAYFHCASPEELLSLTEETLGSVNGTDVPESVRDLIAKVRQEAMTKAMKALEAGDEPEQYKVCSHPWDRNLLVNAGPGAGKTHVLMLRAAHLIHQQGLRPEQILILAFNRAVVHEIRARIKRLFDGLGYGAYVRRLRVRTFHSFALEHMREDDTPRRRGEDLDTVVEEFCHRCAKDTAFARTVVSGLRAILVDEFQDMNDSRYELLKALVRAANENEQRVSLGIMVIGDDDQDILRWNRTDNPVEAREYFSRFRADFKPDEVGLRTNFRSSDVVVQRSQSFIDNILTTLSDREKHDIVLRARSAAPAGVVEDAFPGDGNSLLQVIRDCHENVQTCAILCRTNYETNFLYESLRTSVPGLQIQGRENLKLDRLRHIATWVDACQGILRESGDLPLDTELFRRVTDHYNRSGIPEIRRKSDLKITFLWDTVVEENPKATIAYFLALVAELGTDDYVRLLGKTQIPKWAERREKDGIGRTLVSTINKVKGLEFDTVVIRPSATDFPFANDGGEDDEELALCQADEARLFYVGMTRAKRRLVFSCRDRERAWMRGHPFEGSALGTHLEGSPSEVFVSQPGFDDAQQDYIRTHVLRDDALTLRRTANSIALLHGPTSRVVGYLERRLVQRLAAMNIANGQLRVHAVYRYPITEDIPPRILQNITELCKSQGWLYTVLVTGLVSS